MQSKKFTIQKYSGMAGVFLLLQNNSDAQAIYTDIDPDISIQFDGQTAGIDMDNNGTFDFAFLKTSGSYTYATTSFTFLLFGHRIWAGPEIIENEIAGEMVTHGAGYGTTYFPYALNFGETINEDLSFQYWGFQLMAQGFTESDGDWNYEPAYWSPTVDSNFLGVKFIGYDGCMHYGWIRCTTANLTRKLIIHDYAFENKCDIGIIAGDTIGDTSGLAISNANLLDADIYSFGKTINIITNERNVFLNIYDLKGEQLINKKITNELTTLKMNGYSTSVYIVELNNDTGKYVKRVFIE
ncbi:MAG: T9SS type A sorting domain-containing protein [Chitinophagales bacterium]|jgi:hypothetical protein|nr:T9SS type A sorting domain-containing protein [Chitinophagales bacterium]